MEQVLLQSQHLGFGLMTSRILGEYIPVVLAAHVVEISYCNSRKLIRGDKKENWIDSLVVHHYTTKAKRLFHIYLLSKMTQNKYSRRAQPTDYTSHGLPMHKEIVDVFSICLGKVEILSLSLDLH